MSNEPVPELENVDEESVDENIEIESEISEDDINDTESFIDETELVSENSEDLEISENEDDEYDDEHDPFMDLGTTLGYWVDRNDLPELQLFQLSATTLEGNPSREGILEMYENKSGHTVNNPVFYYVFGLFKIAVIAQQIYFRYKKGFTKDKRFGLLNLAVMSLSVMAKQAIAKDRLSNLFE